jgi:short-subunit dehydrogenase
MTAHDPEFSRKYGPWALIAGGSEGIGRSFALQLAARGLHLILLARSRQPLDDAANEIRRRYPVEVIAASLDLTAADLDERIGALTVGRDVGLVIYNAGANHGAGLFLDQPLDQAMNLVRLNCVGPLVFAHRFGALMRSRGRGGMILMSSMAGLAGMGFCAA